MRIQIFSDLHADVRPPREVVVFPDVEVVVVAGDTCQGAESAFMHLRLSVPMQIPILMVMGNHEYYRRSFHEELARAREVAPLYGVHLLENDTVIIDGVRFIGATLWTDYALFGEANLGRAMVAASRGLNDHRRISWTKQPWTRFRPQEALLLHHTSRKYIEKTLAESFVGPTVVVTHHAPHVGSLHPRYANEILSAAYVSDLSKSIEAAQPDLWVHGHVHSSFDYKVGGTRIVCNSHGYGSENADFNASLVVEVGS
ncbi:MAG: metallophosphoesterase [Proteobacteria bacterium]|jgi:Icc-related predicted phosphoesterase|nr:metallophosphoesterase [Pseudomonadota bacterium]